MSGKFVTIDSRSVFMGGPGQGGGGAAGGNVLTEVGAEKVGKFESQYLGGLRDKEVAAAFDKDGEQIFRTSGSTDMVKFQEYQIAQMQDSILTHNHPVTGGSFSDSDIRLAIRGNVAEIRAVGSDGMGNHYAYSMIRPPDGWGPKEKYVGILGPASDTVKDKLWGEIKAGRMSPSMAEFNHNHETMKIIADAMGWNYSKKKIKVGFW